MRIFLAGATGATGLVFAPLATSAGHELLLHVRPQSRDKTPLASDPRARIFDLADAGALRDAVAGCDAIVSMVGTMRKRFAAGDTYASSDVATAEQVVGAARSSVARDRAATIGAARAANVPRLLLLSSFGAGGRGRVL